MRRGLAAALLAFSACPSAAPWPGDYVGTLTTQLDEASGQRVTQTSYLTVSRPPPGPLAQGELSVRAPLALPGLANVQRPTCAWKAVEEGDALTLQSGTCTVIDTASCRFRLSFASGRMVHGERTLNLSAVGTLSVQCEGRDPAFESGERGLRVAFEGKRQ